MKRNSKKAFTIVELVIVIAVIAILAAVLIPTFAGLIEKANVSNDRVLVMELNKLAAAYKMLHDDMDVHDAIQVAEDNGFSVAKLSPRAEDRFIVWDEENDRFGLVVIDPATGEITQWEVYDQKHTEKDEMIYIFSSDPTIKQLDKYHYIFPTSSDNLDEAIANLSGRENATITLYEDVVKDVVIPEGTKITINLNNREISNVSEEASTITVKSGAKLIIEGDGTITSNKKGKAVIYVEEGGEVVLNGGRLTRENYGEGTWYTIFNLGTMTLGENVHVEVSGGVDTSSSLIVNGRTGPDVVGTGTMTINGGTFIGEGSNIIKNEQGLVTINGGTFINNHINEKTGDADRQVLQNNDKMVINDGEFIANNDCNVVWMSKKTADLTVSGGEFSATQNNQYIFQGEKASTIAVNGGTFLAGIICYPSSNVVPTVVRATFSGIRANSVKVAEGSVTICTNDLEGNWGDIICPESELSNYEIGGWNAKLDTYYLYAENAIYTTYNLQNNELVYLYKSPVKTVDIKINTSYQYVFYLTEGVDASKLNFLDQDEIYKASVAVFDSDKSEFAKKLVIYVSAAQEGAVASIERNGVTIYYDDFYKAAKAGVTDDTVKILADATLSKTLTFYDNVTIDLGGHTVTSANGNVINAYNYKVNIINGTLSGVKLKSNATGFLGLENVTLKNCAVDPGVYGGDVSGSISNTRYYGATNNGDGTWTVGYKEGYKNTTTMVDGYIEVLDNGVYTAVKVSSVADLEAYKGKIVNSRLTFDLDGYQAEGYAVKYGSSRYTVTYVAEGGLTGGYYTTDVSNYLKSGYMMYLRDDGTYAPTKITDAKITNTYAGKICGGIFTEEQYKLNTDGALADGYQWQQQADGTWKVVPA